MAGSKVTKTIFKYAYGIGASIVIVGALAKILHADIMGISGSVLLAVGMGTEAIIFFMSAFEPVEEELDWSLVYPELKGGEPVSRQVQAVAQQVNPVEEKALKESLSEKLDAILAEANIDANLMRSLGKSIENFAEASKEIAPISGTMVATHKYGEELSEAASNLESLNSLYKLQLERTERQVSAQAGIADNLDSLNKQMLSFKDNLKSLNTIYGGMLSAMGGAR
ncbi:MAG: gliding motility protein GldL [Capnocytophaga leadbetteri]